MISLQPLYHQPTDTEVYMANKRQYAGFKRRLMEYFKKKHASKNERDLHLTQTYSKLMTEWLKRVEKVCVGGSYFCTRDSGTEMILCKMGREVLNHSLPPRILRLELFSI